MVAFDWFEIKCRYLLKEAIFLDYAEIRNKLPIKNDKVLKEIDPVFIRVWCVQFFYYCSESYLWSSLLILTSERFNDFSTKNKDTFERCLIRCLIIFCSENKSIFFKIRASTKWTEEREHFSCCESNEYLIKAIKNLVKITWFSQ